MIRHLNLEGNKAITSWQSLPSFLHTLDLSSTNITEAEIGKLPGSLHTLVLSHARIKSLAECHLSRNFPFLHQLDLSYCDVTDEVVQDLPSRITKLNLRGCKKLTNACMLAVSELSNLTHLDVTKTFQVGYLAVPYR